MVVKLQMKYSVMQFLSVFWSLDHPGFGVFFCHSHRHDYYPQFIHARSGVGFIKGLPIVDRPLWNQEWCWTYNAWVSDKDQWADSGVKMSLQWVREVWWSLVKNAGSNLTVIHWTIFHCNVGIAIISHPLITINGWYKPIKFCWVPKWILNYRQPWGLVSCLAWRSTSVMTESITGSNLTLPRNPIWVIVGFRHGRGIWEPNEPVA